MPITLPETSARHYLTGTAALCIPNEQGDVADWHFDEAFLREGTRFRVAGVNFPDTSELLGSFGIRECAAVMRRRGVAIPPDQAFYAADVARAVLDVLLTTTARHQRVDFLDTANWLSLVEHDAVVTWLVRIRDLLSDQKQRRLIDAWLATSRPAHTH